MKVKQKVLAAILILALSFPSTIFGLSQEEELKYGKEIFIEIAKSAPVNTDPYISLYLDGIKERLEASAILPFPIVLTVIDSGTLDAFATMGGYVFITTGLLATCDREDELAGVLAHEFMHVGRRHVAKQMEKGKYINIGMLATMLVGMLMGGGNATGAVLATGIGSAQALSLKYTREDEDEADRFGSVLADKAGYGGLGSADFLKKLRSTTDSKDIPQYLLTHPWPEERVVKLESMWPENKVTVDTSFFPFVQVRAQVFSKPFGPGNDDIWINGYQKNKNDPVSAYAAALVYLQRGDADEAVRAVNSMKSPYKNIFLGEVLVNARQFNQAITVLRGQSSPIARLFLARAYEGLGNGEMAANMLHDLAQYGSIYPDIYHRLGISLGRLGREGDGYAYLGRYYMYTGKTHLARIQFEKAISKYGMNSKEGRELLVVLDQMKDEKKEKGP